MNKQLMISVLLFGLLLAGCHTDEKMFTATSNNWTGDVFVQQVQDDEHISYTFKYMGDDLQSVVGKDYVLSLETPFSTSQRKDVLAEDGIITNNSPSQCLQCLDDEQNLHATITIQLDGKTETIVFKGK